VSNLLAFIALLEGDRTEARLFVDEALRTAAVVGSETLYGYAIAMRSLIASFEGEDDAVESDASAATAIFDRVGYGIGRFYVAKALAFQALSRDQHDEVEAIIGPVVAQLGRAVAFAAPAFFVEDLIDARLATGDADGVEALVSGLEHAGRTVDSPLARVVGARGRALLASAHGQHELALNAIAAAEHMALDLPIPSERARTLQAKGQILRRARRKQAAREALSSARTLFEELGMPVWVARADADLARIGFQRGGRFELTETELRIAVLAASGLTNRQIGAEAFVTPKTVEDVISRIYTKLGIRSRAELGARMAREE